MDDYKDPSKALDEEEEVEEEDIDIEQIKKAVAKGKNKEEDVPHAFDVHTPNEVFSSDEEVHDPRFDEDDPEIDPVVMSDNEDDEEDGAGFFGGSDYGTQNDPSGLF